MLQVSPFRFLIVFFCIYCLFGCGTKSKNKNTTSDDPNARLAQNQSQSRSYYFNLNDPGFVSNFVTSNEKSMLIKGDIILILTKEYPIVTNGLDLTISVNEIRSKDGVIETFPLREINPINYQTAELGVRGRDGGRIEINSKKISGHLTINLRGEVGGVSPEQGEVARQLPLAVMKVDDGATLDLNQLPPSYLNFCSINGQPAADANPENIRIAGKRGRMGSFGARGLDGLPSGSTGDLAIESENLSDSNLEIIHWAIPGGSGGPGGGGSSGGPGGEPSTLTCNGSTLIWDQLTQCNALSIQCPKPPSGTVGPNGPPGLRGNLGPSSVPGDVIINGEYQVVEMNQTQL